jgi:Bardet-Biedl syndrome 5 protein
MSDEEEKDVGMWQDRDIRFDITAQEYALRPGEFMIDTLDMVEDTKGNNGEKGMLCVTNLRLLWNCTRDPKINLSIGYNSVLNTTIHNAASKLRGTTQALYISTKFVNSRFEFVFTYLIQDSPRLFTTVGAVWKAYDSSRLYRDLKLRCAIIRDGELMLVPKEQINNKLNGVWNLSSDQGNLGTMFITNIRVVWFANLAENFNVSIPYIQMVGVRIRESKFGQAFVIETSKHAGNYTLGFRVDPVERLKDAFNEVNSLWKISQINSPFLGVEYQCEDVPQGLEANTIKRIQDGQDVVTAAPSDAFAAYYADEGQKNADRKPEFNATLGLAVEALRDGVTIEALWRVPA